MLVPNLPHPIPNETAQYREARHKLLQKEADLREMVREVAAARAALPLGGKVAEDFIFTAHKKGKIAEVAFSELFGAHDSLLIYSLMYGPDDKAACPMCVSFLDSFNGAAPHIKQRTALAIVTSAPIEKTAALADNRGWTELPMLSCSANSYNLDYYGQAPDGTQLPICNVFQRTTDGIFHFWASELFFAGLEGQPKHIDTMWPLWNTFDMLPQGRGTDWYPSTDYAA